MNWSSAVIVRMIVRYVPVGLEALLCVIYVDMCTKLEMEEETENDREEDKNAWVRHTPIHLHYCIVAAEHRAWAKAV